MEIPLELLVVLAHPRSDSLGAELARRVRTAALEGGAHVAFHDLYADAFDPRLGPEELSAPTFADPLAEGYVAQLLAADAIVIVHPVWFFGPPAILKGWVDRVVREGVAFELGAGGEVNGRLRAGEALVVTTGNAGTRTEEALGDPVSRFWRDVVLGPAGVRTTRRLAFSPVRESTPEQRESWLAQTVHEVGSLVERARAYGAHRAAEQ